MFGKRKNHGRKVATGAKLQGTERLEDRLLLTLVPNLPPGSPYYLAFVTSGQTSANLGGVAGADLFVDGLGDIGTMTGPGNYRAIISDGSAAQHAFQIFQLNVPIYNTSGALVATDVTTLFAGPNTVLSAPISFDENGVFHSVEVWTGTDNAGTLGQDATGWTNPLGTANLGFSPNISGLLGSSWVNNGATTATEAALYGISGVRHVPPVTGSIHGQKWHDLNGDGVRDPNEPGLDGWTIEVVDSSGAVVSSQVTHSVDLDGVNGIDPITEQGLYWIVGLPNGSYLLREIQQPGWEQTSPKTPMSHTVTVTAGSSVQGVDFGNTQPGSIHGKKYEDLNGNGQLDQHTVVVLGGIPDGFVTTNSEPTNPRLGLENEINNPNPQTDYDGTVANRQFLESLYFVTPTLPVQSAFVRVHAKPISSATNDSIDLFSGPWITGVGAANRDSFAFGSQAGNAWDPTNFPNGATIDFPLSSAVLTDVLTNNRLDIYVQDDTSIDYIELHLLTSEPCLPNWPIHLTGTDGMGNPVTISTTTMVDDPNTPQDETGHYWIDNLLPGNYTITEGSQPGWVQSAPASGNHTVNLQSGDVVTGKDFGNYQSASIHGQKWHDLDGDGVRDPNEPGLDGWTIEVVDSSGAVVASQVTHSVDLDGVNGIDPITEQGLYWIDGLPAGTYLVREIQQPGWEQTSPATSVSGRAIADNWFQAFTGSQDGSVLAAISPVHPGPGLTPHLISTNTTDDYLYFSAWGDGLVAQGFLGDINLNGALGSKLLTGNSSIEVCATGNNHSTANGPTVSDVAVQIGNCVRQAAWQNTTVGPTNSAGLYGVIGTKSQIDVNAEWIWHDTGNQSGTQSPFVGGFDHDEYLIFRVPIEPGAHTVTVAPGTSVQGVDFGNTQPGSIHGKKYEDLNGNGQLDQHTVIVLGGIPDGFVTTNSEPTNPRLGLENEINNPNPQTDYDGTVANRQFLESLYFVTPTLPVQSAFVRVHAKPISSATNDSIDLFSGPWITGVGAANRDSFAFGSQAGNAWDPTNFPNGATIDFPLSSAVLTDVLTNNRLEIYVQDDTSIDYIELHLLTSEPCLPNWPIHLTGTDGMGNPVTISTTTMADDPNTPQDETGHYWIDNLLPGNYTVNEGSQLGWVQSAPASGNHTVNLQSGDVVTGKDFGNYQSASIHGQKWHDIDGDGVRDPNEPPLGGWTIFIDENNDGRWDPSEPSTVTNANGEYWFMNLSPGTYVIGETMSATQRGNGWRQTFPGPGVLYAAEARSSIAPLTSHLHTISTLTGAGSLIGATTVNDDMLGMDFHPNGSLYGFGTEVDPITSHAAVYSVTTNNGVATSVATSGAVGLQEGGFAIHPHTGRQFILSLTPTGATSSAGSDCDLFAQPFGSCIGRGPFPLGAHFDGLAYRGPTLYGLITDGAGALNDHLVQFNAGLTSFTPVGPLGVDIGTTAPKYGGLAYDPLLDVFYATGSGNNNLFRINPNTGHADYVGATGIGDVSALTFDYAAQMHTVTLKSGSGITGKDFGNHIPDTVSVPWDTGFCQGVTTTRVKATITNNGTTTETYTFFAQEIAPIPGKSNIAWPTGSNFSYIPATQTITIAGNSSAMVFVDVKAPAPWNPGDVAAFQVTVTDSAGMSFSDLASVQNTTHVCVTTPGPSIQTLAVAAATTIPFTFTNTSGEPQDVQYRIEAMGSTSSSDIVSINGLAAGTAVEGSIALAPDQAAELPVTIEVLEHDEFGVYDLIVSIENEEGKFVPATSLVLQSSSAGPKVTNVLVGSASWSATYKALIPGGDSDGYLIPHGPDQTRTQLWRNIRQLILEFDQRVQGSGPSAELVPGDFQLSGINSGAITILSPVEYDTATNRAKLTLASNLQRDRYVLRVDGIKVRDLAGNALDGEFAKHQLGPSGDGTPGGDLFFDFNVMPGDFNRNGDTVVPPTPAVDSSDLSILGASWLQTHLDPFYRWNADANGDLRNDSSDLSVLGSNWLQGLPAPSPGPTAAALAPLAARAAAAVEDDRAVAIVDRVFAVSGGGNDGDAKSKLVAHLPLEDLVHDLVHDVFLAKHPRRGLVARRGAISNVFALDEQLNDRLLAEHLDEFNRSEIFAEATPTETAASRHETA